MKPLTILASGADRVVVPRALRMNLLVRLIMPWLLPAWAARTLPFAVTLKRFLALDFVFILGISVSFDGRLQARLGMPLGPVARIEAPYTGQNHRLQGDSAPYLILMISAITDTTTLGTSAST